MEKLEEKSKLMDAFAYFAAKWRGCMSTIPTLTVRCEKGKRVWEGGCLRESRKRVKMSVCVRERRKAEREREREEREGEGGEREKERERREREKREESYNPRHRKAPKWLSWRQQPPHSAAMPRQSIVSCLHLEGEKKEKEKWKE